MLWGKAGVSGGVADAPLTEALLAGAPLAEAPEVVSVAPGGFITPASVSAGGGCLQHWSY